MKKTIFLLASLFTIISNAQEIKYGAKLGLNISSFSGDVIGSKSLIGLQVGGFAEIKVNDKFAFQSELFYSTQGAKSEYSETDFDYTASQETKTVLNYLLSS